MLTVLFSALPMSARAQSGDDTIVGTYTVVITEPGGRTRVHHHGPCETSIFVMAGRARFTFGPTGVEDTVEAEADDIVFIPAHEPHVEENASTTERLVVLVTRNCPSGYNVYLDDGPADAPAEVSPPDR